MSPNERAKVQSSILDAVRASVPGGRPSQGEIAAAAGCDRTEIGRFAGGSRVMDLDELEALADTYGAEVVYGAILASRGLAVAPVDAAPSALRELSRATARITRAAAELGEAAADAVADGVADEEEAAALETLTRSLEALTRRVTMRRVRPGRVA